MLRRAITDTICRGITLFFLHHCILGITTYL